MGRWALANLELFVVLAFGIGGLILEWYCKRFDAPPASGTSSDQCSVISAEPSDPVI